MLQLMLVLLLQDAVSGVAVTDDAAQRLAMQIAASVDDTPIYVHEIDHAIEKLLKRREVIKVDRNLLRAATLARLIDRRLVDLQLAARPDAAGADEVDATLKQLVTQLQQQKRSLAEHLAELGMTEQDHRRQIAADLNWQRHRHELTSDSSLQAYFKAHVADFDGRKVHVRHILLALPRNVASTEHEQAVIQATAVRDAIENGQMTFVDAARKHSDGPTARDGGDIGFLQRFGEMSEPFSRAAFSLAPGEISGPVTAPFGVHLIKCVEIEPGNKTWTDVREQLRTELLKEEFARLAEAGRASSNIRFMQGVAHFKLGTRELVIE